MIDNVDIQTVDISSYDEETIEMEAKAKDVAYTLTYHYPNYPWCVGWHPGGALCVKLMLNPDFNWGYTIDAAKSFSASDLAHSAMIAGGELLEALGMRRGAWDGSMPTQNLECVPENRRNPIFDVNRLSDL